MQVVYSVEHRMNPVLRFILRACLLLLCLGAAVFTTVQFVKALHRVKQHPVQTHGSPVPKPIIKPFAN